MTLDISVDEHTVLAGFQIATTAATEIRNGYYEVSFDGEPRDVELSIATTTFRKEKFIERNIELVKTELLASDYDIAKHLTMHVIDNGSTLDAAALSDEHVIVTPNENVGGAGGFARGMIESLEQSTPATHVLLMDDDVEVSAGEHSAHLQSAAHRERRVCRGLRLGSDAQHRRHAGPEGRHRFHLHL